MRMFPYEESMVPGFKYGYDCRLALRPSGGLPMILNSRH